MRCLTELGVITGAEDFALQHQGLPPVPFIINSKPNRQSLLDAISTSINNYISHYSYAQIVDYLDVFHGARSIALKYIQTWTQP